MYRHNTTGAHYSEGEVVSFLCVCIRKIASRANASDLEKNYHINILCIKRVTPF